MLLLLSCNFSLDTKSFSLCSQKFFLLQSESLCLSSQLSFLLLLCQFCRCLLFFLFDLSKFSQLCQFLSSFLLLLQALCFNLHPKFFSLFLLLNSGKLGLLLLLKSLFLNSFLFQLSLDTLLFCQSCCLLFFSRNFSFCYYFLLFMLNSFKLFFLGFHFSCFSLLDEPFFFNLLQFRLIFVLFARLNLDLLDFSLNWIGDLVFIFFQV